MRSPRRCLLFSLHTSCSNLFTSVNPSRQPCLPERARNTPVLTPLTQKRRQIIRCQSTFLIIVNFFFGYFDTKLSRHPSVPSTPKKARPTPTPRKMTSSAKNHKVEVVVPKCVQLLPSPFVSICSNLSISL
jgi:hypothetical protein